MRCPTCKHPLSMIRTSLATGSIKTSEADCDGCGRRWTMVVFIAHEANGNGKGSHATATKIRKGALLPTLKSQVEPK